MYIFCQDQSYVHFGSSCSHGIYWIQNKKCWQCLYCFSRQNQCWSYFAFSLTSLVKMVARQVRNAWPAQFAKTSVMALHEKVSDWIRIAKFPYPYTTGLFRLCSLSFRDGQRFGFGSYIILFLLDLDWISIFPVFQRWTKIWLWILYNFIFVRFGLDLNFLISA